MSDSKNRQTLGLVAVLALVALLVWLLSPSLDTGGDVPEPTPVSEAEGIPNAPVELEEQPDEPIGEAQVVIIDDPEIPRTGRCELIAGWAQRRVAHYTILDNIRDQAMKVTEDDLACLTAARDVPPIVLRFAEMYQLRDQE